MEAYWACGGMAPRILYFGTRWRWMVSFRPQPLYPQGKGPWYPLDRRLDGPPEPVWTRWWRETFPAPAGTRNTDHPAPSPALYHWAIPAQGRYLTYTNWVSWECSATRQSWSRLLWTSCVSPKCICVVLLCQASKSNVSGFPIPEIRFQ
jgi:hypothetical protein